MEKAKFPTKEEMRRLRLKGVVPWSRTATRAGIAATVLVLLVALTSRMPELRPLVTLLAFTENPASLARTWIYAAASVVIFTSLAAVASALLATVLQTRLLPKAHLLRWRSAPSRARFSPIFGVLSLFVGVILGTLLSYRYTGQFLLLARRSEATMLTDAGILTVSLLKVVIVGSLVLAILTFVGTQLAFRFKHRSRARTSSQ
jgi:flagellar biosynthesis protein FlhB